MTEKVTNADKAPVKIMELIIATTAPNDAKLVAYVANSSDQRKQQGKFEVSLAFWETLESYIL